MKEISRQNHIIISITVHKAQLSILTELLT